MFKLREIIFFILFFFFFCVCSLIVACVLPASPPFSEFQVIRCWRLFRSFENLTLDVSSPHITETFSPNVPFGKTKRISCARPAFWIVNVYAPKRVQLILNIKRTSMSCYFTVSFCSPPGSKIGKTNHIANNF
jgi:hypothetical protein